jgi:hypothetical protein
MTNLYFNNSQKPYRKKKSKLKPLSSKLQQWWHPEKNIPIGASEDFSLGSRVHVWWLCEKGHEWHEEIARLHYRGYCNYCAKRLVTPEFNLAVIHPELVKEWHPTRNFNLNPSTVLPSSNKKVWWLCKNNHEWSCIISNRSIRSGGCRKCSDANQNKAETPFKRKDSNVSKPMNCKQSNDIMLLALSKCWT